MAEPVLESNGISFLWTIENYNMHVLRKKGYYQSPIFVSEVFNRSEWRLKLCPDDNKPGYLTIEMEKLRGSETWVEISFYLLTNDDPYFLGSLSKKKIVAKDISVLILTKKNFDNNVDKDLSRFLAGDSLTLKCHLKNEETATLPLVVYSALTQFPVERLQFIMSLKNINEASNYYWYEKIVHPTTMGMPSISIKFFVYEVQIHDRLAILIGESEYYNVKKLKIDFKTLNANDKRCYRIKIKTIIYDGKNKLKGTFSNSWYVNVDLIGSLRLELSERICRIEELVAHFDLAISSDEQKLQVHGMRKEMAKKEIVVKKNPVKMESIAFVREGIASLADDLENLLTSKKFCDVTLKVEGKEFLAHKYVLAARSPVFCTIFESKTKEKETGVVSITDIDPETFSIFLNYIYSEKIESFTVENIVPLYSVADKYQVPSLKKKCSSFILDNLSATNVCDVLILSDMHQDEELKKAAQDFFCLHFKTILISEEWAKLMQKKLELGTEVLKEMALRMH